MAEKGWLIELENISDEKETCVKVERATDQECTPRHNGGRRNRARASETYVAGSPPAMSGALAKEQRSSTRCCQLRFESRRTAASSRMALTFPE